MQEDEYRGDGLNLYAYCGNNPVRYYDPSGYAVDESQSNYQPLGEVAGDGSEESEVKRFYTVQNDSDAERLQNGGTPWPTDPHRADLGDGLYTWGTLEEAENYLAIKQRRAVESGSTESLKIMTFSIAEKDLNNVKMLDLRLFTDNQLTDFLDKYQRLSGGMYMSMQKCCFSPK